jgi:hypothetical protein
VNFSTASRKRTCVAGGGEKAGWLEHSWRPCKTVEEAVIQTLCQQNPEHLASQRILSTTACKIPTDKLACCCLLHMWQSLCNSRVHSNSVAFVQEAS